MRERKNPNYKQIYCLNLLDYCIDFENLHMCFLRDTYALALCKQEKRNETKQNEMRGRLPKALARQWGFTKLKPRA